MSPPVGKITTTKKKNRIDEMRFVTTELFSRCLVWRKCCKQPPPLRPVGAKLGAHSTSTSKLARSVFLHALCTMFTQQPHARINTVSVFTKMILEALELPNCANGLYLLRTKTVMLEKEPSINATITKILGRKAAQQNGVIIGHSGEEKHARTETKHPWRSVSARRQHICMKARNIDELTCETTHILCADIWCGEIVANNPRLRELLESNWQHTHTASTSTTSTSEFRSHPARCPNNNHMHESARPSPTKE